LAVQAALAAVASGNVSGTAGPPLRREPRVEGERVARVYLDAHDPYTAGTTGTRTTAVPAVTAAKAHIDDTDARRDRPVGAARVREHDLALVVRERVGGGGCGRRDAEHEPHRDEACCEHHC